MLRHCKFIPTAIGRANRRLRRASDENSETAVWLFPSNKDQDGRLSSWAFKMCHLQPFRSILSKNFFQLFHPHTGGPFLLPQRANYQEREFFQLQNWMRQRVFSALGIQTRPFAAHWATFVSKFFHLFHFHTGRPILITPEGQYWEKGQFPNSKTGWERGFSVSRAFKLDHLHR